MAAGPRVPDLTRGPRADGADPVEGAVGGVLEPGVADAQDDAAGLLAAAQRGEHDGAVEPRLRGQQPAALRGAEGLEQPQRLREPAGAIGGERALELRRRRPIVSGREPFRQQARRGRRRLAVDRARGSTRAAAASPPRRCGTGRARPRPARARKARPGSRRSSRRGPPPRRGPPRRRGRPPRPAPSTTGQRRRYRSTTWRSARSSSGSAGTSSDARAFRHRALDGLEVRGARRARSAREVEHGRRGPRAAAGRRWTGARRPEAGPARRA